MHKVAQENKISIVNVSDKDKMNVHETFSTASTGM